MKRLLVGLALASTMTIAQTPQEPVLTIERLAAKLGICKAELEDWKDYREILLRRVAALEKENAELKQQLAEKVN